MDLHPLTFGLVHSFNSPIIELLNLLALDVSGVVLKVSSNLLVSFLHLSHDILAEILTIRVSFLLLNQGLSRNSARVEREQVLLLHGLHVRLLNVDNPVTSLLLVSTFRVANDFFFRHFTNPNVIKFEPLVVEVVLNVGVVVPTVSISIVNTDGMQVVGVRVVG